MTYTSVAKLKTRKERDGTIIAYHKEQDRYIYMNEKSASLYELLLNANGSIKTYLNACISRWGEDANIFDEAFEFLVKARDQDIFKIDPKVSKVSLSCLAEKSDFEIERCETFGMPL